MAQSLVSSCPYHTCTRLATACFFWGWGGNVGLGKCAEREHEKKGGQENACTYMHTRIMHAVVRTSAFPWLYPSRKRPSIRLGTIFSSRSAKLFVIIWFMCVQVGGITQDEGRRGN